MATSNPAFSENIFNNETRVINEAPMTVSGAVNKTFVLFLCLLIGSAAVITNPILTAFVLPAAIIGLIVGFVIIFKKTTAPYLAPIYALVEGVVIGAISLIMEASFPGIVLQAVSLTFAALFTMLILFKTKMIRVTEKFRSVILISTFSILIVYFADIILSFFSKGIPLINGSGMIGIGFSLFVVAIASLNLLLDFDFIQRGEENLLPKYFEWYGAFGLMVTLIWLYLEILKLLAKLKRR